MPFIETTTNRSGCFFHLRATDATHKALTGQASTFSGGDGRTGTDSEGTSYNVARGMPRFDAGDGTPRIVLDESESEVLSYAWNVPFAQAFTLFLTFLEGAKSTIAHIGDDAAGTPYLTVTKETGGYRVTHHNGTSSVQSEVTIAVSAGERVELRVRFQADGAVRIHATVDGGAEGSGSASSALAPAAWSSPRLHFAGIGTGVIELESAKGWPDPDAALGLLREVV